MLTREKESQCNIKHRRNNTIALTYDVQNTSTKLMMLNLSNKDENRLREHGKHKEHSKEFSCCHCLSNTAPACACHHRDKDLSQYPRRHESCSKDHSKKQKFIKSNYHKSGNMSEKEAHWPSLTKAELIAIERKSNKYQANFLPERLSEKDLWLLSSIPALSHPDFNLNQRKCLLSLAKIYTNVSPGPRCTAQRVGISHSKLAPLSHRSTEKKCRSKVGKNVKGGKHQNPNKRKDSLPTAVRIFQSEPNEIIYTEPKDTQESFIMTDEVSDKNVYRELLSRSINDDNDENNENENVRNDSRTPSNENMYVTVDNNEDNQHEVFDDSKVEISDSYGKDTENNNEDDDIYEIDFSDQEVDFLLNDYVLNILKQQADNLQLESKVIISPTTSSCQQLEKEGLQSNVETFQYQEIPDNIVDRSSKIDYEYNEKEMADESINKDGTSNNSDDKFPNETFSDGDNISQQQIKETMNESDKNDNNSNIENVEINSDGDSIESNNLEKINSQIDKKNNTEFIAENPLRIISAHLRQSILS